MAQDLWTLTLFLALTFHGETEGDETLETQGTASISTQINHATPQSPTCGSLECFPRDPVEEPNSHLQHHGLSIYTSYWIINSFIPVDIGKYNFPL